MIPSIQFLVLITSSVDIKGFKFSFYDTAGIRKHTNKIEEIGIKKTKERKNMSNTKEIFEILSKDKLTVRDLLSVQYKKKL